ncbi:MAG: hypothetical protein AAFR47_05225 [Pseudomonadota bacterium]
MRVLFLVLMLLPLAGAAAQSGLGGPGAATTGLCLTAQTCCCTMDNGVRCCGPSGNCNGGAISGCPCRATADG